MPFVYQSDLPSDIWIRSISELNDLVRKRLQADPNLNSLWLRGEILNLTKHSSGHIYFSLKDDNSQIRCTFFRQKNVNYQQLSLKDGAQIIVFGSVSVYTRRGEYQFNIQQVMLAGEGTLRLQIEALKKQLSTEGLFDVQRKKTMPHLPITLGVATSATGAAIKDIMRIARNRYPSINILLAPCQVQGEGAVVSIIQALELLQLEEQKVDVIIVGRGGGSFEDLLPFNDEALVRAIASCRLPIVSAVGHDIDHPLSDLAADFYASTPTAAAERVVPELFELALAIEENQKRLYTALWSICREKRQHLAFISKARIYQEPIVYFARILAKHRQYQ